MKRVRKMTPKKTTKMTAPRAPRWTPPARTEAAPIASPMPGSAPNGLISHGQETISAVVAWENGPGAIRNANVAGYEARVAPQFVQEFNRLMFGGAR
jgi:hypothetical protein